ACARASGARVVAVATGMRRREILEPLGPDLMLDDLSDRARILGWAREIAARGCPAPEAPAGSARLRVSGRSPVPSTALVRSPDILAILLLSNGISAEYHSVPWSSQRTAVRCWTLATGRSWLWSSETQTWPRPRSPNVWVSRRRRST